jgi:hypothetical protein
VVRCGRGAPNPTVQRTGASRFDQRQIRRHRRLAPVADLCVKRIPPQVKRLLLIIGLAFGAVGATLSVVDVTIQPFPYEFEAFLRAPAEGVVTLLSVLGIGGMGDVLLWNSAEIALNTVLFMLGGAALLLLLHVCRIRWHLWSTQPELSTGCRLALLTAAWGIAIIAALASGHVASGRDFAEAAFWFPLATWWLVRVPWANPVVGWLLYLSVTTAAAFTRERKWYLALFAVLCSLLALNVVGCHALPPPGSNLM